MGIAERKEREKQEMRDRILDAATAMFLEEGYEKTSIRNIADKIEYSPATIYLYFKDKDDLFFAIHEIGFQKLLKKMEKAGSIQDPLKRLRELGAIYIEFALNNPEYYDLMFIMRAPINSIKDSHQHEDEQCWHYGEMTKDYLRQTVLACIEEKRIKITDADIATLYTWSAVHGMVSLYIRERCSVMEIPESEMKNVLLITLDEMIRTLST